MDISDNVLFEELDSIDAVRAIEHDWDLLLEGKTLCCRPFHAFLWFVAACECFGWVPRVFVVKEGGTLTGILPLARNPKDVSQEKKVYSFPLPFMIDDVDMIFDSEMEHLGVSLLRFCLSSIGVDDKIFFRDIRGHSVLAGSMNELVRKLRDEDIELSYSFSKRSVAPVVDTSRGWDAYLAAKSQNFRETTRRSFRKLEKAGFRYEWLLPDSKEVKLCVERFLLFHLNNLKGQSFLAGQESERFVTMVFPALIKKGYMNALTIRDSNNVIQGVHLSGVNEDTASWFLQGYAANYRNLSFGRLLCLEAIRYACDCNMDEYGLGRNPNDLKNRLKTEEEETYYLEIHGLNG